MRRRSATGLLALLLAPASGCHLSGPLGEENGPAPVAVPLARAGAQATAAEREPTLAGRATSAALEKKSLPIDLPTALRLAGADNLQIQFTRQRLQESLARSEGARVLWLPSIGIESSYQKHDGRLQATEGEILDASKNSGFVGGGPAVSFHLGEAIFEPLAASQDVRASRAALSRSTNDTLLEVALAYLALLEAEQERANAKKDVENAQELVDLTTAFSRTGQGNEADAARARSELAVRRDEIIQAEEGVLIRGARLANLLRLDPKVGVRVLDQNVAPISLIPEDARLEALIDQAVQTRPEKEEQAALLDGARLRLREAGLRPLVPELRLQFTAGAFGGGSGSRFSEFDERTDFTASVVWELRNLGLGDRSLYRQREAQLLQAHTLAEQVRDAIVTDVTTAYHQTHERRRQIVVAQTRLEESARSLELNMRRIRGVQGLPIEALQAIQSVAAARRAYVEAVTRYNEAQFLLMRAVGEPPHLAENKPTGLR